MEATEQKDVVGDREPDTGALRPSEPLEVARHAAPECERPDEVEDRATDERCAEHGLRRFAGEMVSGGGVGPRLAGLDEVAPPAEDDPDLRVLLEIPGLQRELLGDPEVVLIEKADQLTARLGDTPVASRPGALVLLGKAADALVRARDLRARVARAVVDDDHVERPVVLGEDAVEGLRQKPLAVVGRDDDADQGCLDGEPLALGNAYSEARGSRAETSRRAPSAGTDHVLPSPHQSRRYAGNCTARCQVGSSAVTQR